MRRDSGQAAPLYVVAVAGLLFVALLFFTFGEADIRRSGAQSAADAAALAAAKESRSLFEPDLLAHLEDPDFFDSVFNASFPNGPGNECGKASEFAELNDATDVRCRPLSDGRWGYQVSLRSAEGMSTDLVPGTKGKKASAVAVAVIEPRCAFVADPDSSEEPEPDPDGGATTEEPDPDPEPEAPTAPIGTVRCEGGAEWGVGLGGRDLMPDMADLFSVRLAED
ncbi:pilus assembly protein TadG-related protein [Streptomyces sp. NPDC088864]|uniref:pilus assembly protein TadG-related protein n=1 Tax=Streptomyces sp. NPDC088864 TaxID=3365910 RepID=UPI0038288AB4